MIAKFVVNIIDNLKLMPLNVLLPISNSLMTSTKR
jgi:hypothetical protein